MYGKVLEIKKGEQIDDLLIRLSVTPFTIDISVTTNHMHPMESKLYKKSPKGRNNGSPVRKGGDRDNENQTWLAGFLTRSIQKS